MGGWVRGLVGGWCCSSAGRAGAGRRFPSSSPRAAAGLRASSSWAHTAHTIPPPQLWSQPTPDPAWAEVVPHFRHLTPRELAAYGVAGTHTSGWFFTTIVT